MQKEDRFVTSNCFDEKVKELSNQIKSNTILVEEFKTKDFAEKSALEEVEQKCSVFVNQEITKLNDKFS